MAKKKSNMEGVKRINTTSERMMKVYPNAYYRKLTVAYADYTGDSQSRVINDALKSFFEKIPAQEREKILTHYGRPQRQSKNGY